MDNSQKKKEKTLNTAALLAKKHTQRQQRVETQNNSQNPLPSVSNVVQAAGETLSNISLEKPKSWFSKAWGYVTGFAFRVAVHFGAFICAAVLATEIPKEADQQAMAILGTYFGIICLIARGTSMKPEWLVPACCGFIQLIAGLVFGFHITEAIFWGGAQAFLQRVLMKKFSLGSEWFTAVFIVPLALVLGGKMITNFMFLGSFVAIAALGAGFGQVCRSREAKKEQQKEAKKQEEERIKADKRLQAMANDPFYVYVESTAELRSKLLVLPKEMQPTLVNLTKSSEAIILCMREDKRDQGPGEKFLKRYLPATHSVLENYCKLAGSAVSNDTSAEKITIALKESEEVLKRLELAFKQEHSMLLRNDVDDFSADLRVLDTLLKMDGR